MTSAEGRSYATPDQLDELGFFEDRVWDDHRVLTLQDFDKVYPTPESMFLPLEQDREIMDEMSKFMLEASAKVLLEAGPDIFTDVAQCPRTLPALEALAKRWKDRGLRIPSLVGILVHGRGDQATCDLRDGWEDRMPINEDMKDPLFRLNNIKLLDVLVCRVGAKEDVHELILQMQLESHLGGWEHLTYLKTCIQDARNTKEEETEVKHEACLERNFEGKACINIDNQPLGIFNTMADAEAEVGGSTLGKNTILATGGVFHFHKRFAAAIADVTSDLFMDDMNDVTRPGPQEKTFYNHPPDTRQRQEEQAQQMVAMQMVLWEECMQSFLAEGKDVAAMNWKDVDDYMMNYAKTNLSAYPIVLWMRLCNLMNMLRACPRAGKRGDFELYRQCARLANCLFTLSNATSYVRTTLDERISLETCNRIDYLIRKVLCFTGTPFFQFF